MPLTEREVGLLWRYHDWLARHGYVLCDRLWRLEPGSSDAGSCSYQPVHAQEVAGLLARFMAQEAGGADQAPGVRRQATEDQDGERERDDG